MSHLYNFIVMGKIYRAFFASLLTAGLAYGQNYFWDFEDVPAGSIPPGWKVEATRQRGPLPTWKVIIDSSAPSGTKVLAMVRPNHRSAGTFNLCWTDSVQMEDGILEVKFRAIRGKIDRGGGIMWRVKDRNNYYVARYNPLENNFRIYYVKNGKRVMIASAEISLPAGKWHTMKIVQRGDRFEGYLNGRKFLSGRDRHIRGAGGVGLWTKADAVTRFDDFRVEVMGREK